MLLALGREERKGYRMRNMSPSLLSEPFRVLHGGRGHVETGLDLTSDKPFLRGRYFKKSPIIVKELIPESREFCLSYRRDGGK